MTKSHIIPIVDTESLSDPQIETDPRSKHRTDLINAVVAPQTCALEINGSNLCRIMGCLNHVISGFTVSSGMTISG